MFAATAAVAAEAARPHPIARHTWGCRTDACDVRVGRAWWLAHHPGEPVVASWYDDEAEAVACSGRATYGVAHLSLPCGTRVRLCNGSRCLTATVDDRGPFVAGRTFDLGTRVHAALRCPDLCGEEGSRFTWSRMR